MAKHGPIQMSMDDLLGLPVSFPLETAGQAWGFSRGKCLYLRKQGKLPFRVHQTGPNANVTVTKADLFASLGLNLDGTSAVTASLDPSLAGAPVAGRWLLLSLG